VISLVLIVAAAAGLMGLVVLAHAQNETIVLKAETGLAMVAALEQWFNHRQAGQNPDLLFKKLAEMGFEKVVLVDRRNNPVAASRDWPWTEPPSRAGLALCMDTREIQTWVDRRFVSFIGPEPSLALAAPLYKNAGIAGAVGLYSSLKNLKATWRRIEWTILVFLALDTVVTVLFGSYILSRRLVRPLKGMVQRFEDLAAGKYQVGRLEVEGRDEISRLQEAFELMAARLMQSQLRLKANLEELTTAQDHLVRSEKMASVGRLAAGLAHELGNPLGSIQGFIHLIKRGDLSLEEQADFLDRVESELTRMDGIIRSLLDFARLTPGKSRAVDLNQVVLNALALSEVQKWASDLDVVTELQDNLPSALGEDNRLIQVALNLMSNAGQAMAGKGRMTVTTGKNADEVFMKVADTGPGIAPDDMQHIFEPFFTRKEPGQGTGLGLSVSQSIVESFGGRIEVISHTGQGAVFTVFLPAIREEEAA
jgi:two-component system NtrC family sensor kinase